MILALLALVVMGLAAAAALQNKQIEAKRASGLAEASVLESLRNAAQAAVYEHLAAIQQGQPMEKGGVTVTPSSDTGELTWTPTVAQLRDMGYLPSGWSATRSSLNEGAYGVTFHRTPVGCPPTACDVQGVVVLGAPVLDAGRNSPVDGVVIGPILTRAGADGGVSLPTGPATISGFHGTWSSPNPVAGTPAGVVAIRFGTQTGGFNQFVRVGDLRDPGLRGNLSAAGDLSIDGSSRVRGESFIEGELRIGPRTAPCVTVSPVGALNVRCSGVLNAHSGVFEDLQGNRSEVVPTGVVATGRVEALGGLRTSSARIFEKDDPNAIQIQSGEFDIRGPLADIISFRNRNFSVYGAVSTETIRFSALIEEGTPCSNAEASLGARFGSTPDRSLAVCVNDRWIVSARLARVGRGCSSNGGLATDIDDGQSLLCRAGFYIRTASLISNFVLIHTASLDMSAGSVRVQKPLCRVSGGPLAEPLILLSPNNEDVPAIGSTSLSGINRYAIDDGADWIVVLERSADGGGMSGNLIALIYCHYP